VGAERVNLIDGFDFWSKDNKQKAIVGQTIAGLQKMACKTSE
jgi:hypothetical protein